MDRLRALSPLIALPLMLLAISLPGRSGAGPEDLRVSRSDDSTVRQLARGNNVLAFTLHHRLAKGKDNLVFSPICLSHGLAILHAGAAGKTATQIRTVLDMPLDDDGVLEKLGHLFKDLNREEPVQLTSAASLWVQFGVGLRKPFRTTLEKTLVGEVYTTDFTLGNALARRAINRWVRKQTRGLIPETVDSLPLDTKLYLATVVYFKGEWEHGFDPDLTRPEPFHVMPGREVEADMMYADGFYDLYRGQLCDAVTMYYKGGGTSMTVLLPKPGQALEQLESSLDQARLAKIRAAGQPRGLYLVLPKFTIMNSLELDPLLREMGMVLALTPGEGDFSRLGNRDDLFLSRANQKALIQVDEKGTVAAAATGFSLCCSATVASPEFRVDRPFVYVLQDERSGAILFMGRLVDPSR